MKYIYYSLFGLFILCQLIVFSLSYNFQKYKFNLNLDPNSNPKSYFRRLLNDIDGVDQRYPYQSRLNTTTPTPTASTTDINEICEIKSNFQKLDLMNKLNSNKISSSDKLNLIKESDIDSVQNIINNKIRPFDITSGGLYNDWLRDL
jgi:hypothetical protein